MNARELVRNLVKRGFVMNDRAVYSEIEQAFIDFRNEELEKLKDKFVQMADEGGAMGFTRYIEIGSVIQAIHALKTETK